VEVLEMEVAIWLRKLEVLRWVEREWAGKIRRCGRDVGGDGGV
jgi:hypothetical protein